MLPLLALACGLAAVAVGTALARTWLRHGGAAVSHFSPLQVWGHAAVGVAGVALVAAFLLLGREERWGWTAVGTLVVAGTLGATMFLPWWRRGRRGEYGDHDPAGFHPAEDHFSKRTVNAHGALADLTWVLLVVALLTR